MRTTRLSSLAALLLGAALLFTARPARAQFSVIDQVKKRAAERAAAEKRHRDSLIVARAGETVDSGITKTGRGVDTAVAKAGAVTDTVLNRGERGVKSIAGGKHGSDDAVRLSADLADDGRVVLDELRFTPDGSLDPASRATVRALAKALGATGSFLVEGHVAASGGAAADQARAESRAKAVKAALVAEGVDAGRLFVMALGAARPPASGRPAERVEIARMQ